MWTSNDMTLPPCCAAEQFARDCYPDAGRVYGFTGSAGIGVWTFSIYCVRGYFTLTRTADCTRWLCNRIPAEDDSQ